MIWASQIIGTIAKRLAISLIHSLYATNIKKSTPLEIYFYTVLEGVMKQKDIPIYIDTDSFEGLGERAIDLYISDYAFFAVV